VDVTIEEIRAARRELDAVVEEIRAVPGHEDFLSAPTFDDIAGVSTADHPMVYIAAAELGGLALVVRGTEVEHVALDELTAAVVRDRVGAHLAGYQAYRQDPVAGLDGWRQALDQVTEWLWPAVVGPVLERLGSVRRAVFVPGGLLGLLPLHAAWTTDDKATPGRRRYALDTTTITYVPNARALAAARRHALLPADRVLTVADPPHRASQRPLAFARVEAELAAGFFAEPRDVIPPGGATRQRVLDGIAAASVAHLACHGFADLAAPLDSGLLLADQAVLQLRDLLALRSDLRLAVLSACETSMVGTELPDEVVSLPTGLLQAGVGGVVASLWAVPDLSTALLMTEFYRQWRCADLAPPEALRAAQLWLRDTSNLAKIQHLTARVTAGELPRDPVEVLLDAVFRRGEEGDGHVQQWAGFGYVGA
jgi:hypothetical protein